MNQLKNILVAVDFSDCSRAAMAQAVRLAGWNGATLHALHVIDPLVAASVASGTRLSPSEADQFVQEQAHARLTAWLQEAGGQAAVRVVIGTPLHEVLVQARQVAADLLVAGARGASAPRQGAGTLAAKLARKAPTKVLLVSEGGVAPFGTIVAAVDFSATSGRVVGQATRVAGREPCDIRYLHVFDPPWRRLHYLAPTPEASPDFEKQYTDALQGRLEAFVAQHHGAPGRCVLLPCSSSGHGIVQYAREVQASLVILGRRGQTTLRYLLMGSTAERLLRELPCSVLTVLPPDGDSILPIP